MSELETADARGNGVADEDCPLCLEPLPPFWDERRRVVAVCCGKYICACCRDQRLEFLQRAPKGRLAGRKSRSTDAAPSVELKYPALVSTGTTIMLDRFEKGQLPLNMYFSLGMHLGNGTGGVERNVERGMEILELGAEKGDPNCQYWIGCRYHDGVDGWLPKITTEAKRWYLAAIEQGHAVAECSLADLFKEEGNDVEHLRYLRSSASKGYDGACYNLGLAHYNGESGLERSTEEAIRVVTPAAERGDASCMRLLGELMCFPDPDLPPLCCGDGWWHIDRLNFTKGMHWLRRSAAMGDQIAISALKRLEERVSNRCFRCNKEAPPEKAFLRCSKCRAAWYCSKDCQVQHWKSEENGHKQFCINWK